MWGCFSLKIRSLTTNTATTKCISIYFHNVLFSLLFRYWISMKYFKTIIFFILLISPNVSAEMAKQRIITLAPHLAEIVHLLDKGQALVAVSEASDYPDSVRNLPTVANYRGLNFTEILRAKPTHILAWQGGNQSKDIQKLKAMGLSVLAISITSLDDITEQILKVGAYLDATNTQAISKQFATKLAQHRKKFIHASAKSVFYYSSQQPLFTIGKDAWVTKLLATCQLTSMYNDSAIPYPEANLAYVLATQPDIIISSQKQPLAALEDFWRPHQPSLNARLLQADPDQMHRFTPRVLDELDKVCTTAHL